MKIWSGIKKLEIFIPWLALLISFLSAYYAFVGVQIARESNRISQEAQEINKNLFLAEKRPYLNIFIPEVSSNNYLNIYGDKEPVAEYSIELRNEGGTPARDIYLIVYYFDAELKPYNTLSVYVPETQKILPGKSHFIEVAMSDKEGTGTNKAINSGELRFQAVVQYKSDVDIEQQYKTKKQFSVRKENVILLGNLGEFE